MDVQEAVRLAKDYVRSVYADEQITNVGLEEIKLDGGTGVWRITIGFSRPWDAQRGFAASQLRAPPIRSLKVVNIDDGSGNVVSMAAREAAQLVQ